LFGGRVRGGQRLFEFLVGLRQCRLGSGDRSVGAASQYRAQRLLSLIESLGGRSDRGLAVPHLLHGGGDGALEFFDTDIGHGFHFY
jgi:hypothetical protein